ncbi:MAG: hypothetical protein LBV61_08130 [Burkholderiaceae bacterium]|jgi:hypothetical protein|nr:hypothetical protein [Burkholderiaceae bacterium]
MSKRPCPERLVLNLDAFDRGELDRYMRFIEETDQCAYMGIAAHAASLIAFGLELHEQFQQWRVEQKFAASP